MGAKPETGQFDLHPAFAVQRYPRMQVPAELVIAWNRYFSRCMGEDERAKRVVFGQ